MTLLTYLQSLESVRGSTSVLLKYPSELHHFDLDLDKLPNVIAHVLALVKRDYASPSDIPPHSRWRHFEVAPKQQGVKDRLGPLISSWKQTRVPTLEIVKRLLDLFIVSVLLDAGAGADWHYTPVDEPDQIYNRSEGLALASLDWFLAGGFSHDATQPHQVTAQKLKTLTKEDLIRAFQVSESNPLIGQDRIQLLVRLGHVCESFDAYFGTLPPRPGNLVDFLLNSKETVKEGSKIHVHVDTLWEVVMQGLSGVWPPTRTRLGDVPLGDVWPSQAMASIAQKHPESIPGPPRTAESRSLVTFHKLSQWLTYSLMEPLSLLGIEFVGLDQMTGLAEYRNGGLFVDAGVLKLKEGVWTGSGIPQFAPHEDVIVEWRALTVGLLDLVGQGVREALGMSREALPLVKVLEAGMSFFVKIHLLGTWKAGREMAAKLRPQTKGPPIEIISDGTVF